MAVLAFAFFGASRSGSQHAMWKKYDLQFRGRTGVTPLLEQQRQTLTDTSIPQENGSTVLRFTKNLVEDGELAVIAGETNTRFNSAIGASNYLAQHHYRGSATHTFDQCLGGNDPSVLECLHTQRTLFR